MPERESVTLDSVAQRVPAVVSRLIDGEAVLVHPGQGKVRVLNPVGARLWELANGDLTVGEMARVIAAGYDVDLTQAEGDTLAFCCDLADRGVMTLIPRRPASIGRS
jgi:hypothetical protein